MSDYGDTGGLSTDELMQMLAQMQGGNLPGKTPASQLNYYQDLVSTLGFDPVQQAGISPTDAPVQPEYLAPINKQRAVYESDPVYKQIFDLVDQGNSPASAVSAAFRDAKISDGAQMKEAAKIAADYAMSNVDELNARNKFEADNVTKRANYTQSDGSKYKNAPLGGSDINASASEYSLLGSPTIGDLESQLASVRGLKPQATFKDLGPQARSADAAFTTQAAKPAVSGRPIVADSVNGAQGVGNELIRMPSQKATPATVQTGDGPERSWEKPSMEYQGSFVGGNSSTDAAYRNALNARIEKSKTTQVRSDANTNAIRRVLALRKILEG